MRPGNGGVPEPAGGRDVSQAAATNPGAAPDLRAWAELLRLPALFTVPGDALAGAATVSAGLHSRTLLAIGSSLCLYEAGMALNDWADRDEDARDRPHRPLPSGRVRPSSALAAACGLTAAGLALASRAGRPALTVAVPLAATVWAYDLALKHTPAGPVAMAAARGLDLLLGAAASTGRAREAVPSAALLATHTLAVTSVSRRETTGGAPLVPLAALATTGLLTHLLARRPRTDVHAPGTAPHRPPDTPSPGGPTPVRAPSPGARIAPPAVAARPRRPGAHARLAGAHPRAVAAHPRTSGAPRTVPRLPAPASDALRLAFALAYPATAARPYLHAALNPSPPLTQRAVGGGIRATIPLQAALTARAGGTPTALLVAALAPLARRFARKVSVT
ncbi:4-hydroxybenzoate polyprenyltransferase [Streptomyces sp. SolWspMP-5a-2]|nr:prenyltransferase [Streptomyces sp. SID4950]SCE46940.1 4-hydroxybenzoate polyprenyltransferase [Streptomyces sp. SolWspMP-5a-2]